MDLKWQITSEITYFLHFNWQVTYGRQDFTSHIIGLSSFDNMIFIAKFMIFFVIQLMDEITPTLIHHWQRDADSKLSIQSWYPTHKTVMYLK